MTTIRPALLALALAGCSNSQEPAVPDFTATVVAHGDTLHLSGPARYEDPALFAVTGTVIALGRYWEVLLWHPVAAVGPGTYPLSDSSGFFLSGMLPEMALPHPTGSVQLVAQGAGLEGTFSFTGLDTAGVLVTGTGQFRIR